MRSIVLTWAVGVALWAACAPGSPEVEAPDDTDGSGGGGGEPAASSTSFEASSTVASTASVGSTGGGQAAGGSGGAGGQSAPDCVMLNGMNINCDPQDQMPCNLMNGEACDTVYNQGQHAGFVCYPAPNTLTKDAACPGGNGEYCQAGLHCYNESMTCKQYCCGDADCTMGGTCSYVLGDGTTPIFALTPTLGLCL